MAAATRGRIYVMKHSSQYLTADLAGLQNWNEEESRCSRTNSSSTFVEGNVSFAVQMPSYIAPSLLFPDSHFLSLSSFLRIFQADSAAPSNVISGGFFSATAAASCAVAASWATLVLASEVI